MKMFYLLNHLLYAMLARDIVKVRMFLIRCQIWMVTKRIQWREIKYRAKYGKDVDE